jgi:hypothetical protein
LELAGAVHAAAFRCLRKIDDFADAADIVGCRIVGIRSVARGMIVNAMMSAMRKAHRRRKRSAMPAQPTLPWNEAKCRAP